MNTHSSAVATLEHTKEESEVFELFGPLATAVLEIAAQGENLTSEQAATTHAAAEKYWSGPRAREVWSAENDAWICLLSEKGVAWVERTEAFLFQIGLSKHLDSTDHGIYAARNAILALITKAFAPLARFSQGDFDILVAPRETVFGQTVEYLNRV